MIRRRYGSGALVSAIAVTTALGLAACGDSDDGGDEPQAATTPASEEQQVRAAVKRIENALYDSDGKEFCSSVTKRLQRATATRLKPGSDQTCEQGVKDIVPTPLTPAMRKEYGTKILTVKVSGTKAAVDSRGADGGIDHMILVKQGGEWKLDDNKPKASTQSTSQ
jgi:hypothetical protein